MSSKPKKTAKPGEPLHIPPRHIRRGGPVSQAARRKNPRHMEEQLSALEQKIAEVERLVLAIGDAAREAIEGEGDEI